MITDEELEAVTLMEEIRDDLFDLLKDIEQTIEYNHISYKDVE